MTLQYRGISIDDQFDELCSGFPNIRPYPSGKILFTVAGGTFDAIRFTLVPNMLASSYSACTLVKKYMPTSLQGIHRYGRYSCVARPLVICESEPGPPVWPMCAGLHGLSDRRLSDEDLLGLLAVSRALRCIFHASIYSF